MEIRYIDFFDLPFLYADLANIEYDPKEMKPILKIARFIKSLVLNISEDTEENIIKINTWIRQLKYLGFLP